MTKPMPSASSNWQGHCNRSRSDQLAIERKLQCTENEKKASEEPAGRAYLVLWKWSEAERINGSVITRGEGSHSGGLKRGDRIFVGATKEMSYTFLKRCKSNVEARTGPRVVSRYACIAAIHALILALTFGPCKPLKTRSGGRGSEPTLCGPRPARIKREANGEHSKCSPLTGGL